MDHLKAFTEKNEYELVPTEDGHFTLYSGRYDEACHSTSGAWKETLYNYYEGCEVEKRALDFAKENKKLVILEIGLGLGYGVALTFSKLKDLASNHPELSFSIDFYSTEIDPKLVDLCKNYWQGKWPCDELKNLNFNLKILVGDARETVSKIDTPINIIYHDAFSPKKNPRLWTKNWFLELKKVAQNDVILSTYSASLSVRKTLHEAGWVIENRKGFGRKRTMTRATLLGVTDSAILERISSPKIECLTDLRYSS